MIKDLNFTRREVCSALSFATTSALPTIWLPKPPGRVTLIAARDVDKPLKYDPKPPFDSGSLDTASAETVAHARELLGPSLLAIRAEAERAARRRG